jgi:transposase
VGGNNTAEPVSEVTDASYISDGQEEAKMPVRPLQREQGWLLPQNLDDLLSPDHPARFVGAYVDALDAEAWAELGVQASGDPWGAPSYHPRLLLSVWLYGFMTGVRSSRKLEAACREQLPYLWLTGLQTPDHNTLWRFYQEHREGMQCLLKHTVKTAITAGLIDLAIQAVDGSKVSGSAAKDRTYDAARLRRLLERTEAAIADLEAQNRGGAEAMPARLPQALRQKQVLAQKVKQAVAKLAEGERTNLTDADSVLLRGKDGFINGYNVQAVVSPLREAAGGGQLITATMATQHRDDHAMLVPMMEAAEANTGVQAEVTLADAGYHSGENLAAMAQRGQTVLMPESQQRALTSPYHKDAFTYDEAADTYTCPEGQTLRYSTSRTNRKGVTVLAYRLSRGICRVCPAFGICTKDTIFGRSLHVSAEDALLKRQRALMASPAARSQYKRRGETVEPTFGIMKEQQNARRFLLRGLENVGSEWSLLAVAFNLRTLARVWKAFLPILTLLIWLISRPSMLRQARLDT